MAFLVIKVKEDEKCTHIVVSAHYTEKSHVVERFLEGIEHISQRGDAWLKRFRGTMC